MEHGVKEDVVRNINTVLANQEKVDFAILYGSRAKGTFTPGSDIDLALKGEKLGLRDLLQLKLQLDALDLPYEIDVSILEHIRNQELIDHIERVGVIFYNKRD